MQYELYVDSLFVTNFVMNLYLLLLVNRSIPGTATPWRLLLGAAVGALSSLLCYLPVGMPVIRLCILCPAGTAGMLLIAFPVKDPKALLKLLEKLLLYSFGLGGILLLLIRTFPKVKMFILSVPGMLVTGMLGFAFLWHAQHRRMNHLCKATLICSGNHMTVSALIDSGNSLWEPISGKPVSIIDEHIFHSLWKGELTGFRAIPYHSIGKRRGILQGYLLPELKLEVDGVVRTYRDVYVAVGEEGIHEKNKSSSDPVKMLLHPAILKDC